MTHISHVTYTAWLPIVTHVTFTELLVYDSCYEQSMTRILYDSCHFHNMHVTYMIHATCAAWFISCKLPDSFITNVTIYIQYSKTHTVCIWLISPKLLDSCMNNNTYLSRLICDSCHVQRMARIWLMLRTQYNITRIWLLRTPKQPYSCMIHITFPAWLIKISFHVHSMTHMWLISRSSMTHKDLMPCSQYDSYVTHITCTSWLIYDSCHVHSMTHIHVSCHLEKELQRCVYFISFCLDR